MRRYVRSFIVLFLGLLIPVSSFAASPLLEIIPQFRETIQDKQGSLHTVWVSQDGQNSSLLYKVTDASGRAIAGPILISESSARIRRPQVAIDGRNVVHVLWQERAAQSITFIRYTKLRVAQTGIAALLPQPLTLNRDQTATHPSLAVDQAGWAYAAWEVEGRGVVLTAIDPAGHISHIRQITNHDTKTKHALPAVAVDRRGNVHVVWSTQAGDTTQIIYKALRGHGGQVLEKEKIVYTTIGTVDQTKVVTFDPQGNVKVSWVSSPRRQAGQKGRVARLGAKVGSGYVLLRSASDAREVVTAVDESIQSMPERIWSPAGDAIASAKPWLAGPALAVERMVLTDPSIRKPSSANQAISKILRERMLRYSRWPAPPPARRPIDSSPRSSSLRVRHLSVSTTVLIHADSDLLSRQQSIDQMFPMTQGGGPRV